MSNIQLMLTNSVIAEFDLSRGYYKVFDHKRLPIVMQRPINGYTDFYNNFIMWLNGRILPLNREHAWLLYNIVHIERDEDPTEKMKLCLFCKGVSVLDNYWIRNSDSTGITWDTVNVRHVPLNQTVFQVALHESACTLQGDLVTPEYTTNGTYAKAWRRNNGKLYLLKKSGHDRDDASIEEFVSNILDKMTVEHVPYEMTEDNGVPCCSCPCIATDLISIVPARQYRAVGYKVSDLDPVNFARMCVVDYLIMNADRHGNNYGIYVSSVSNKPLCLHPLFDHNKALHPMLYDRPDFESRITGKSMRETALKYIKYADLAFTGEFTPSDFPEVAAYDEFMRRAEELKIPTIKSNATDLFNAAHAEQKNANEWDLRVALKLKYKELDLWKALGRKYNNQ